MNAKEFVSKWSQVRQKESSVAQSHFNDICALASHKSPLDIDPKGDFFTFEEPTEKSTGDKGRADVWYKGKFIWEYKGFHKNLDKAYQQLQLYRESLGNPPLLITSDSQRIIIHTNFTNTVKQKIEIDFDSILNGSGIEILKRVFKEPESYKPEVTQEQVTKASADTFVEVADILNRWASAEGRKEDPEQLAHFIIRLLFSMFSEDLGILPDNVFTDLVSYKVGDIDHLSRSLRTLFAAMRTGGDYGHIPIPYFDGGLFDDDYIPDLPGNIHHGLRDAASQDWSAIDPSIFGTLFERIIDESKRAQLGAHYTSKEDMLLVIEPVLMQPLRNEWQDIKQAANRALKNDKQKEAFSVLETFSNKLASTRVLDPACGSGNFLYVALRQLLDLQKEIIVFAARKGLIEIPLTVSPKQLYGIELNQYAHELAQITVWIGYYQWRFDNGFIEIVEPILRPLKNIELKDAVLSFVDGEAIEPDWPEVEVIIGNPPFLGTKKIIRELGVQYKDGLQSLYSERIPGMSDLVCYWFEKARFLIEKDKVNRVGFIATQAIRGGFSRVVLDRILETGNLFWAYSDRNWVLDGAAVHVSMIGFDGGEQKQKILDGQPVLNINSNLTTSNDLTQAKNLSENQNLSFIGTVKGGKFDIKASMAKRMLEQKNDSSENNQDVIKPWVNGSDLTQRPRNMWIIDFGNNMSLDKARKYQTPLKYVLENVKPKRDKVRRKKYREKWWLFSEPCIGMRNAISNLSRYIITPRVSKHRIFVWMNINVIPDSATVVIARDDDYMLGVVHSRAHELWARGTGTQLREAESGFRYSQTFTFETFPLPWSPGEEPKENESVAAIGQAAHNLVEFRQAWLHIPKEDIGVIISEKMVKKRTLTNMYNALTHYRENVKGKEQNKTNWDMAFDCISLDQINTLDYIHSQLDNAVLDAYGWPHNISDEQILENLLALNLERSKTKDIEG